MTTLQRALCAAVILLLAGAALAAYVSPTGWTWRQDKAHEIAELAREIGLAEDNPIIVEASRIWWEEQYAVPARWWTEEDRDIIARVIYNEAGYGCTERHMELVGAVIVNRVESPLYPDTVYGVVTQAGQYHASYADAGSYYGRRARESDRWEYCCDLAERALNGEVDCPDNVLYQANFRQGAGVYEYGYTSYSTTFFCYG